MRRLERESAERMRRLEKEFADKERFLDDKYSAESKGHRGGLVLAVVDAHSFVCGLLTRPRVVRRDGPPERPSRRPAAHHQRAQQHRERPRANDL